MGILGPQGAKTRFFQIFLILFKNLSIDIAMSFVRIIFN